MDGTEPDDTPGLTIDSDGKTAFRFTSSKVFLTYSQANDLDRSQIIKALVSLGYHKVFGSEERHDDGGRHFHIMAESPKTKTDIKNPRYWDITSVSGISYHPNVRRIQNPDRVYTYISKDGDTFSYGRTDILIANGTFRGFSSRKRDLEEFNRYVRSKTLTNPFPLRLPLEFTGETIIDFPKGEHRQRCLWVWGPANTGKSYYFQQLLNGTSTFYPGDGELSFDNYLGEVLLLYDDKLPPLPTLIDILNVTKADRTCPGRQRYSCRFLLRKQARFVIIITNQLVPWMLGCTNSLACKCPGCTRTIYFDWTKNYLIPPVIVDQNRVDFT